MNGKGQKVIMTNEAESTKKIKELQPEDMFKVLYICVNLLGNQISIPVETLATFPADANLTIECDDKAKRWVIRSPTPKSRRKKILRKRRKLILPG